MDNEVEIVDSKFEDLADQMVKAAYTRDNEKCRQLLDQCADELDADFAKAKAKNNGTPSR